MKCDELAGDWALQGFGQFRGRGNARSRSEDDRGRRQWGLSVPPLGRGLLTSEADRAMLLSVGGPMAPLYGRASPPD